MQTENHYDCFYKSALPVPPTQKIFSDNKYLPL